MTILVSFLCLMLSIAAACAAFVYGRQIGYTQRDNESKQQEIKSIQEQLEQMMLEYT